jgi:speckle-type POZ protein
MSFMATTALLSAAQTGACRLSRSASSIVTREVTGYHKLKIDGYEASRKLPKDWFQTSRTFEAAGQRWKIKYVPRGGQFTNTEHVSLYLQIPDGEEVQDPVSFRFSLLDQVGNPVGSSGQEMTQCFFGGNSTTMGFQHFIKSKDLLESGCLKDDSLTVRCDITLIKSWTTEEEDVGADEDGAPAAPSEVVALPSDHDDLQKHIADLQCGWRATDTTIVVGGEEFRAHRWLLGARSPVFAEELLASPKGRKDPGAHRIEINDMEPRVFKSLLRYIYTDSLPASTMEDDVAMARRAGTSSRS